MMGKGKRKGENRVSFAQKILKEAQLPLLTLDTSVRVTLSDNLRADVEGADGIIDYDQNTVKLKSKRLIITITGNDLCINQYSETITSIEGFIHFIGYERSSAKK